jgi:uncharacterized protein with PIN domain
VFALLPAMNQAAFRFYAELNDFLPAGRQHQIIARTFDQGQSVKHLVEALGVPHPEVELVLANGRSVGFGYLVRNGDSISIYPPFKSIDVSSVSRVQHRPLSEFRFVLDGHLGRLAAYLRMVGFDTLYQNDFDDAELARISHCEERILLTRDRGLLKRSEVVNGRWLRETSPRKQLVEVLRRYDLFGAVAPFRRCLRCNSMLQPAPEEMVNRAVPPMARQNCDKFLFCQPCAKVYWRGSHVHRMRNLIEWALAHGRTGGTSAADEP